MTPAAAGTLRSCLGAWWPDVAATALAALVMLSRPQAANRGKIALIATAPLVLLAAIMLELMVVPSADWGARLVGSNSLYCLSFIPLMGIVPLALFIAVLRHGAPSHPALAGAVAGLAAGGIAATLYAAHCTDDSPLFVATWYTLAIAILTERALPAANCALVLQPRLWREVAACKYRESRRCPCMRWSYKQSIRAVGIGGTVAGRGGDRAGNSYPRRDAMSRRAATSCNWRLSRHRVSLLSPQPMLRV